MPTTPPLQPGRDYTVDAAGRWVFTAAYLLARGTCCRSGCRNCPYPKPPPESAGKVDGGRFDAPRPPR